MKKFLQTLILMGISILIWTSCSQQEEPSEAPISTITRSQYMEDGTVSISYLTIHFEDKVFYHVPTSYDDNGDFIFGDSDFKIIFKDKLENNANFSIQIISDKEIAFYPSLDSNLQANDLAIIETKGNDAFFIGKSRLSMYDLAILNLYDDKGWEDTMVERTLTLNKMEVSERRLKDIGFNDKCSSLKLTNNLPNSASEYIQLGSFKYACTQVEAVFVGYEDKDYTGKTFTATAPAGAIRSYYELPGFNDKISSFKFFFAQKGQYTSN